MPTIEPERRRYSHLGVADQAEWLALSTKKKLLRTMSPNRHQMFKRALRQAAAAVTRDCHSYRGPHCRVAIFANEQVGATIPFPAPTDLDAAVVRGERLRRKQPPWMTSTQALENEGRVYLDVLNNHPNGVTQEMWDVARERTADLWAVAAHDLASSDLLIPDNRNPEIAVALVSLRAGSDLHHASFPLMVVPLEEETKQ